jgi:hypothetical protein
MAWAQILLSSIPSGSHWRHYFLILGALWGLMAASRAYALERAPVRVARERGSLNRRH